MCAQRAVTFFFFSTVLELSPISVTHVSRHRNSGLTSTRGSDLMSPGRIFLLLLPPLARPFSSIPRFLFRGGGGRSGEEAVRIKRGKLKRAKPLFAIFLRGAGTRACIYVYLSVDIWRDLIFIRADNVHCALPTIGTLLRRRR